MRNGLTLLDEPRLVAAHVRVHGVDPSAKAAEPVETAAALMRDYGAELAQERADGTQARAETPEDATVTQEFVNRVAECMEKLNEKHREILILRNVRNLAYEEIAEILGISVGTVKSRIARAREGLRAMLGEDFNNER